MLLNIARIERLAAEGVGAGPITTSQAIDIAGALAKGAPSVLPKRSYRAPVVEPAAY